MNAEDFRVALARLNMSQVDMARYLGVSKTTISKWARGTGKIHRMAELAVEARLREHEKGAHHNAGTADRECELEPICE